MDWVKEHKFFIFAGIAAALFFIYNSIDPKNELAKVDEAVLTMDGTVEEVLEEVPDTPVKYSVIMADIKGAVNHPGVYEIAEGDRVIDLIGLAGGLTEDAESTQVNFAMHVQDEMVLYIPRKGENVEEAIPSPGSITQHAAKQTVNLNSAAAGELETLPGIGPAKAEAIIEYRETNGPFKSIEELKSISGIGDKTYDKLKENISVK